MTTPTSHYPGLPERAKIQEAREHFGFLLPRCQQWFTPREVAAILGTSDQWVRNAFEDQRILGHSSTTGRPLPGGRSAIRRRSYKIHRDSILIFLLETANFTPRDFARHLESILRNRSVGQLEEIRGLTEQQLRRARAAERA